MKESADLAQAWARFADRLSVGDAESFDELVSADAKVIVGTAPGERVTEREQMRFGFEAEGVGLTPDEPVAYEEGSMGWVLDEPRFSFPDGSAIKTRTTSVWHQQDGAWKLVHMHVSVGVPDDEVAELQKRWAR